MKILLACSALMHKIIVCTRNNVHYEKAEGSEKSWAPNAECLGPNYITLEKYCVIQSPIAHRPSPKRNCTQKKSIKMMHFNHQPQVTAPETHQHKTMNKHSVARIILHACFVTYLTVFRSDPLLLYMLGHVHSNCELRIVCGLWVVSDLQPFPWETHEWTTIDPIFMYYKKKMYSIYCTYMYMNNCCVVSLGGSGGVKFVYFNYWSQWTKKKKYVYLMNNMPFDEKSFVFYIDLYGTRSCDTENWSEQKRQTEREKRKQLKPMVCSSQSPVELEEIWLHSAFDIFYAAQQYSVKEKEQKPQHTPYEIWTN